MEILSYLILISCLVWLGSYSLENFYDLFLESLTFSCYPWRSPYSYLYVWGCVQGLCHFWSTLSSLLYLEISTLKESGSSLLRISLRAFLKISLRMSLRAFLKISLRMSLTISLRISSRASLRTFLPVSSSELSGFSSVEL